MAIRMVYEVGPTLLNNVYANYNMLCCVPWLHDINGMFNGIGFDEKIVHSELLARMGLWTCIQILGCYGISELGVQVINYECGPWRPCDDRSLEDTHNEVLPAWHTSLCV